MTKPETIEDYIRMQPADVQEVLQQVRSTIAKAEPDAVEIISYAIPTFYLKGNLVHFAAFKSHIGFYATPAGHEAFAAQLSKYKQGKGSVQFPLSEPMPLKLITEIVKFRVKENDAKAKSKK
ncbi:MAG: iron chaperone [Flavobacteriales bacterium]